jgi:hypothetical protein
MYSNWHRNSFCERGRVGFCLQAYRRCEGIHEELPRSRVVEGRRTEDVKEYMRSCLALQWWRAGIQKM